MAGLKTVIPVTFTDTSLPIIRDDALLSAGSLLLIDPAHSALPWASGVPAGVAGGVANVAWKEAAALGVGTVAADTAMTLGVDAAFTGTVGKLERTPMGGLHVLVSQVNQTALNQGARISLPTNIKTYLVTNSTHQYYMSLWHRITRASTSSVETSPAAIFGSTTTANLARISHNLDAPTSSVRAVPGRNTVGNTYRSIASASGGWTGTVPAVGSVNARLVWSSVSDPINSNSNAFNKHLSSVLYRFYLEDLTASGRSYATVDALDYALYTAAFAAGGRYAGDTIPTDPATFA